jgi:hypothetical protein
MGMGALWVTCSSAVVISSTTDSSRMIGPMKPTRNSGRFARSVSPDMEGRFERNWRAVSNICDSKGISDGPWPSAIQLGYSVSDEKTHKLVNTLDVLIHDDNQVPSIRTQPLLSNCWKHCNILITINNFPFSYPHSPAHTSD